LVVVLSLAQEPRKALFGFIPSFQLAPDLREEKRYVQLSPGRRMLKRDIQEVNNKGFALEVLKGAGDLLQFVFRTDGYVEKHGLNSIQPGDVKV
jgi:hypothetical protein